MARDSPSYPTYYANCVPNVMLAQHTLARRSRRGLRSAAVPRRHHAQYLSHATIHNPDRRGHMIMRPPGILSWAADGTPGIPSSRRSQGTPVCARSAGLSRATVLSYESKSAQLLAFEATCRRHQLCVYIVHLQPAREVLAPNPTGAGSRRRAVMASIDQPALGPPKSGHFYVL